MIDESGNLVDGAGHRHRAEDVTYLPPVVSPQKIIGLALNYADHASELGLQIPSDPALFFKPATSMIGHRGMIVYPTGAKYMHYENELAAVIGTRCRRVSASEALDVVEGYTIANDVTVRDFVTNTFRPPVKAKGWDTFLPIGPYLVSRNEVDISRLEQRTFVNGELRQRGNTADQITKLPELIAYLTEFMTLEPGDLLLMGTPVGISPIHPGDAVRLEIDGLGALECRVVAESERAAAVAS